MKHLRKFNESLNQSDLEDIKDLFQEYADKWELSVSQDMESLDWFSYSVQVVDEKVLVSFLVKLDKDYSITVTTNSYKSNVYYRQQDLKEKCKEYNEMCTDMDNFELRLESIGYDVVNENITVSVEERTAVQFNIIVSNRLIK